jgi:8-oxo-dGTP pyrophosphatase MutT (NUDIX family)
MGLDEGANPPLYERDPDAWQAHLAQGNAKQARKRVAVDVLIRDQEARVLIVKPTYKPGWDLPGGMVEANESPLAAVRRELIEELGIELPRCALLCVDWVPPHGPWDDQLAFIFDGGRLPDTERDRLAVRDDELSEYRFVRAEEVDALLRPRLWRRVEVALDVLQRGGKSPVYLQDGQKAT